MPQVVHHFFKSLQLCFQTPMFIHEIMIHFTGMRLRIGSYIPGMFLYTVFEVVNIVSLDDKLVLKMLHPGHGIVTIVFLYYLCKAVFQHIQVIIIKTDAFKPLVMFVAAVGSICVAHNG